MIEHDVDPVPREARSFQGQPAGLVSRLIANMVDVAVVAAFLGGSYLGITALLFFFDPRNFDLHQPIPLLTITAAVVVSTFYLGICWAWGGRTYGCHVMGLRVVGRGGRRIRPIVAMARAAFYVFFALGLLWCVINPRSRSVQDIVLRTSVVYDWRPRAPRTRRG